MEEAALDYGERGKQAGFVPGVKVCVLRTCPDHDQGWRNSWTGSMKTHLGHIMTIRLINKSGIYFKEDSMGYPWHVCSIISGGVERMSSMLMNKRLLLLEDR